MRDGLAPCSDLTLGTVDWEGAKGQEQEQEFLVAPESDVITISQGQDMMRATCKSQREGSRQKKKARSTLQEVVQKCNSLPFSASSVWAARGLSKLLAANGDMSSKQSTAGEIVGNK